MKAQVFATPEKHEDVITRVYLHKYGRYVYLSGYIVNEVDNPLWGQCAVVHIYALQKQVMVKSNNIIRNGSLVEIQLLGEYYAVVIDNIDYNIMQVFSANGVSEWVNVTSITGIMSLDMMPTAQAANHQIYGLLAEKVG